MQTTAVPQCGDVFIRDVKVPEAVHSRLTNAQHRPKDPSSETTNSVRTREQAGSAGDPPEFRLLRLNSMARFAANSAANNLAALRATLGFFGEFRLGARTLDH